MIRISQCMIVKNEEKNIEKALTWGKDLMWEQIVVDTGSTDKTVEIAAKLGAKIYHFPWVDDFAAAKNYAISSASGNNKITVSGKLATELVNQGMLDDTAAKGADLQSTAYTGANLDVYLEYDSTKKVWNVKAGGDVEISGKIKEHHAVFHLLDRRRVNHTLGCVHQRHMDGDIVTLLINIIYICHMIDGTA